MESAHPNWKLPPWFGAEGTQNGKPLLIRGRRFAPDTRYRRDFSQVFIIKCNYGGDSESGLPTDRQYVKISDFEWRTLDEIESRQLGVAALVMTCCGVVRYTLYVKSAEQVGEVLNKLLDDNDPVEMLSGDDSNWDEYEKILAMVRD